MPIFREPEVKLQLEKSQDDSLWIIQFTQANGLLLASFSLNVISDHGYLVKLTGSGPMLAAGTISRATVYTPTREPLQSVPCVLTPIEPKPPGGFLIFKTLTGGKGDTVTTGEISIEWTGH